jgi:hypothetical protein
MVSCTLCYVDSEFNTVYLFYQIGYILKSISDIIFCTFFPLSLIFQYVNIPSVSAHPFRSFMNILTKNIVSNHGCY